MMSNVPVATPAPDPDTRPAWLDGLPGLMERLVQTDKNKHGFYGYVPFNRDGKEAAAMIAKLVEARRDDALQYLSDTGQLSDQIDALTRARDDLLHDLARIREHETALVTELEGYRRREAWKAKWDAVITANLERDEA